jgi:pilus assembly protein Flp/PilA
VPPDARTVRDGGFTRSAGSNGSVSEVLQLMNRIACRVVELGKRVLSQRGQGLVEYGLILILVAVAVVVALTALSGQLNSIFDTVQNDLSSA